MSWRELVSKQVLRCPECNGYSVVLQFRGDAVHTKCSCGYSKTETLTRKTYPCITCDTGRCPALAASCADCIEKTQARWIEAIISTPPATRDASSDQPASASARPGPEPPASSSQTSDTPAPKPERSSASEPENPQ